MYHPHPEAGTIASQLGPVRYNSGHSDIKVRPLHDGDFSLGQGKNRRKSAVYMSK